MSILNPIFKLFIRKQAVKQTGKIPPADTVLDLNAANLQKRLQNMGIDTSKIKNTKEIEQALNIEKSQWNQQIKQTAEAAPKNILKGTQKKEKPFTGWTPRVVEKSMPTDDYNVLKEEWFGKIIANTDDAINTFLKKGIDKADDRFLNLSKTQRKDFLDMVEYRLKHGNKKFMNDFTDAAGKFKFPENLAGGGRAGYDSGKLVEGETYIPPKNFYGVGLGPLLNEFMSEGRPRDEEGFHTTLNKKDLINLWNYLKENQDIDLEDELMFRFGRFDPEKKSQFHFGVGKDKAEIGFKKKFAGGGIAGMLGEPTYEDDNHRVPLKRGKSVVLKNLAKLFDEFFPETTKIGQTSKPMASKTELRRAITDFQKREKAARKLTDDEIDELSYEVGELDAYPDFDGTVGSANKIRKEHKAYMDEMYKQYKAGKLDPEPGDKSRARLTFLENKVKRGDKITSEEIKEIKELSDLHGALDEAGLASGGRVSLSSGGVAGMLGE